MIVTLEQIRAARAMLGLKQQELAQKAGISTGTLNNIERGAQTDPKMSTIKAIQKALEAEGIEFTESETGALGIRRKPPRTHPNNEIITLLIIDDSDADRKLFKTWLTKQKHRTFNIIEAGNAKDGYEAFLKHNPACIILDFMMYGVDGFELVVNMKKEHAVIPPIIFVTGMHNDVVEKEVKALGVHSYCDKKTLTQEGLYAVVAKALS